MKNAASVFGKKARTKAPPAPTTNWKLPDQLIGVEVEVESTDETILPENTYPYWTQVRDGSLRNGTEFVLVSPLSGNVLSQAISEFFRGARLHRSTTGSTHIHVDMMEEGTTPEMIKTLVLMIYALESSIFSIIGTGREWSGYTNTLMSAPEAVIGLALNANEADEYRDFVRLTNGNGVDGRYYGLNTAALHKYGSVEFRYFPTATSAEELTSWIQMMQGFKQAAVETGTTDELLRIFSNEDLYQRFINTYLGDWSEHILRAVPQYQAYAMAKKALTVAANWKFNADRIHVPPFDATAITNNKRLAKFYKNKVGPSDIPTLGIHVPMWNERRSDSSTFPNGTVAVFGGSVWIATAGGWTRDTEAMSPTDLRTARRAITAAGITRDGGFDRASQLIVQLRDGAGYTPSNTVNILSSLQLILANIEELIGPEPMIAPAEETPAAPTPRYTGFGYTARQLDEILRSAETTAYPTPEQMRARPRPAAPRIRTVMPTTDTTTDANRYYTSTTTRTR